MAGDCESDEHLRRHYRSIGLGEGVSKDTLKQREKRTMTSKLTTPIAGAELCKILEETIVRVQGESDHIKTRLADKNDVHDSAQIQKYHHGLEVGKSDVERLQFVLARISEDETYELTLDDWEFLNSGRGARWILVEP